MVSHEHDKCNQGPVPLFVHGERRGSNLKQGISLWIESSGLNINDDGKVASETLTNTGFVLCHVRVMSVNFGHYRLN